MWTRDGVELVVSIPVCTAAAACVKKRAPVSGMPAAVAFGSGMLLLLGRLTRAERPRALLHRTGTTAPYMDRLETDAARRSSAGPRRPTDAQSAPRPKYGPREAGIPVEYAPHGRPSSVL